MGLLDRVGAGAPGGSGSGGEAQAGEASFAEGIGAAIDGFWEEHPFFHCIVLAREGRQAGLSKEVAVMAGCHGAECRDLSGKSCVVLLPGALDMELFSHRIAGSTGSAVAFQFSADSAAKALEALRPFLP